MADRPLNRGTRRNVRSRRGAAKAPTSAAITQGREGSATIEPPRQLSREETTMQDGTKAQEVFNEATSKALETMTFWAEANQRVMHELVELSAGTAKESIRLYAELQQGAIDAIREGQAAAIRWQAGWQEAPKDPVQWYQKTLAEGVDGAQKWFRMMETNAQTVTR